MKALSMMMIGGAGIAALVGAAAPAAAQYYPNPYPYGYPTNNGGGVVGAIVNALGGGYGQYQYGNYGYGRTNDNYAVDQCSRAVEARLNGSSYGYSSQGYGYGAQPYGYANNGYGGGRIAGITRIDRTPSGGVRVYGVAMSNARYGSAYGGGYGGAYGGQGYGGQAYGYQNAAYPDLRFNCKVDRYGRISSLSLDRMSRYNQNDYYYGYRRY